MLPHGFAALSIGFEGSLSAFSIQMIDMAEQARILYASDIVGNRLLLLSLCTFTTNSMTLASDNFDWSKIILPNSVPVQSEILADFERKLECTLPSDYRAFLLEYNGGRIKLDHAIPIPELSCETFVSYLYPLSAGPPSIGVIQSQEIQEHYRLGLRQAIRIGDDMGTGFFFLILEGVEKGAVYFGFKDDLPMREGDWYSETVKIPECMAKISSSFRDLGELILRCSSGVA